MDQVYKRTDVKKRPRICYIQTKLFDIGMMGRSGSRSVLYEVTKLDSWTNEKPRKNYMKTWLEFNEKSTVPKILVLRNPIERAKAGLRHDLETDHHVEPFLHYIDIEVVTHIIKFEDIDNYVRAKFGVTDNKETDVDISEYDFENEMKLYNMFLEKPVYPADLFRDQLVFLHR